MRYYFSTRDDKNKEQKVGKTEKYVKSIKEKEGHLTMNVLLLLILCDSLLQVLST